MDDLAKFCCQNNQCPDYGKRDAENLTVCGRYGKNKQYRLLYCRTCKKRFSERKGTPMFRARLPPDKSLDVLAHLAEGCGIRQTGRLTGVHRNTANRYAQRVGDHAKALHNELVSFSPADQRGPGG